MPAALFSSPRSTTRGIISGTSTASLGEATLSNLKSCVKAVLRAVVTLELSIYTWFALKGLTRNIFGRLVRQPTQNEKRDSLTAKNVSLLPSTKRPLIFADLESHCGQLSAEDQMAKYLCEIDEDREIHRGRIFGSLMSAAGLFGFDEVLYRQIAQSFNFQMWLQDTINENNALNANPNSFLFGHQLNYELGDSFHPLRHFPESGASWQTIEAFAGVLLEEKSFKSEKYSVPDIIERELFINVVHLLSSVCTDSVLSLGGQVGKGRFTLCWHDRGRGQVDMEDFRDILRDATQRIDFELVDDQAVELAACEVQESPLKVGLCRSSICIALVFFHGFNSYARCSVLGRSMQLMIKKKAA